MAKRVTSSNYYAYLARVQDEREVRNFCNNLPDNLFAVLVSNNSSFAGLVLPSEEYGATAESEELIFTNSEVLDHPLTRESDSRIGALAASYKAYMGSLLTKQIG